MNEGTFKDIEKLETDLWAAADNLRANSDLKSTEYATPVLGLIAVYQQVWRSSDWLLAVASVCLLASLWMAGRRTGRLAEV